jgi:hypothetical protein
MTTLNLLIDSSMADGSIWAPEGYNSVDSSVWQGNTTESISAWHLFTNVSGLAGAVINSAPYQLASVTTGGAGAPLTKVRAERSSAPTAPEGVSDYNQRTRTVAGVDWDDLIPFSSYATKDITAVIQELANEFDPTAILILHEDDGSAAGNYQESCSYDAGQNFAAKLDIDYTVGSGHSLGVRPDLTGDQLDM